MGGTLVSNRFVVICRDLVIGRGCRGGDPCPLDVCRDLLNWVPYVYPPLRGVRDFVENPYDILCIYYHHLWS